MIKTKKPLSGYNNGFLYATRQTFSHSFNNYSSDWLKPQRKIVRVNKKNPCEICGQPSWCSYTDDGELARCMRESAGCLKTGKNNTFIHVLKPSAKKSTSAYSAGSITTSGNIGKTKIKNNTDVDHIHKVYTFMLENLILAPQHADNLLNERGLSDTTIARKLYASVPSDLVLAELIKEMRAEFGDGLKGVAGFYRDENDIWQFNKPNDGFFVPYRDEKGRIQALQVRRDNAEKSKYIWLSTNPENKKFKDGTSSGAPFHFVKPDLVNRTGEIIITEGSLKADIISEFTGKSVVALAGVNCPDFEKLPANLRKALPNLQKVLIAYDSDFIKNEHVRRALVKMSHLFNDFGFNGGVLEWNSEHGKGLDDLFINESREDENER